MIPVKVSAGYEKWVRGDERTVSGTIGTRSAATTTKNKPSLLAPRYNSCINLELWMQRRVNHSLTVKRR